MLKPGSERYTVSVIITTYNRSKLLKRAVLSLINQTYKDFEAIIVDDGSTDKTGSYLNSLVLQHKNFKYVKHSNRGTAYSLNAGLLLAQGKYITILDSDDEYAPEHIEKRVAFFKKNKKVDLVHSPATLIGNEKDMYVPDKRDEKKLIHVNDCIIGGTLFGKREVFIELNGFKDIYSHDSEFYNRAKKIFNAHKLDIPTYIYYRDTPDSIINLKKKKQ